ncbi:MAG TPA: mechanosensitive ion channel family protein [Spirochaetota bacterium]|nr:mechanosensitive ion channel family protein [Spirochaetota bacterium]
MRKFLRLLFLILFSLSAIAAQDSQQHLRKIIFLPFNDYADSKMKYLEHYIPEVMSKNLKSTSGYEAINLRFNSTSPNYSEDYFNNKALILSILKDNPAEFAVTGRFLVHEKQIIIETKVFDFAGKEIIAPIYEGIIDDRFLSSIQNFSQQKDEWIRINILKENPLQSSLPERKHAEGLIEFLKGIGLSFINNSLLLALFVALFFYFGAVIMSRVVISIFSRVTARTKTELDDEIIELLQSPLKYIIILIGFRIALYVSDIKSESIVVVSEIINSLIMLIVAYILSGVSNVLLKYWGGKVDNPRIKHDLVPLFSRSIRVVIFSVVFIIILSRFNIDIAPFVTSLGIAGFAIGFAVKDTLSNIIGGVILILDNAFVVGDKVTIDGDTGFITEVGLRNTKILTFDNEIIVIPNGELMNKKFKNFVQPDPRIRVIVKFSVAYGSNVDKVREVVVSAISAIEGILDEPAPVAEFVEMGDFSLNFVAKFWIPDFSKQHDKKLEATDIIYKALNAHGIEIPFPTNTIYLKKS